MAQSTILTNHPINQILKRFNDVHEAPETFTARKLLDPERKAGFDRAFLFARYLSDLIAVSSDAEVSISALHSISNGLQNALNELSAFLSNQNPGHVDNALGHLDGAASAAMWAFYKRPIKGARAFGETVSSVEKSATAAIDRIEAIITELTNQISGAQGENSNLAANLSNLATEIASNREQSAAAVSEIQTRFQSLEQTYQARLAAVESEGKQKFDETIENHETSSSESLEKLAAYEADAKKIVQIVGNIGVTGNYQKRASDEQLQANLWRGITVTLFAVGVVLVAVTLILNLSGKIDLTTLIARFAIAVAITVPALYTARESARHRTNADRAKQTELELASLSPFLETLEPETRQEIIGDLAKAYFGQRLDGHEMRAPVSIDDLQKTLTTASELVTKVKGA